MEEYDGIIELAARALEEVSVIALHVGRGKRQPLCGRLGGELFIAASLLDSAGAEQEAWLRRKVPKLMRDVESICTVGDFSLAADQPERALTIQR